MQNRFLPPSRQRVGLAEGFSRLIDSAVAVYSPSKALERQKARLWLNKFNYEAARAGTWREQANLVGNASPDTTTINYDRIRCIWETRDLEQNFGFFVGLLDMFIDYVLGDYRIKSKATDAQDRKAIDEYWDLCCQYSDPSGQESFLDQTHLALRSQLRDGDMLGHVHAEKFQVADTEMEFLQLTLVEADCIGYPYEGSIGNGYLNGVLYDPDTGYIKGYRVFQRDPMSNTYSNPKDLPANECLYLGRRTRASSLRVVSKFASVIPTMRDIKEIIENERLGVKWCSSQAGVVTRLSGDSSTDTDIYPDPFQVQAVGYQGASKMTSAAPGTTTYLAPGEDYKAFEYSRPSPTFQGLLESLFRDCCLAARVPLGFAYKAITNGVASRLESAQAERTFKGWQRHMRDKLIMPFRNRVLQHGIETGQLVVSEQGKAELLEAKIIWPAHPTVDVGRESSANVAEYNANLKAGESISEERGDDYDEMIGQLEYEDKKKRKALGLAQSVVNNFGPKGIDALFNVYEQVSSGQVPPANGRVMLKTLFALSDEEALEAIPDTFKAVTPPIVTTTKSTPSPTPNKPASFKSKEVSNKVYEGAPNISDEEELKAKNDQDWISKKIKILVNEGYTQDQAVAIAENMNRERKKKVNKFSSPSDEARDDHGRWTDGGSEYNPSPEEERLDNLQDIAEDYKKHDASTWPLPKNHEMDGIKMNEAEHIENRLTQSTGDDFENIIPEDLEGKDKSDYARHQELSKIAAKRVSVAKAELKKAGRYKLTGGNKL